MRSMLLIATSALVTLAANHSTGFARHRCETDIVQESYVRYLGRQADPCGLKNWVEAMRHGMSPIELEGSILGSDEYFHRNGCTPEGFVLGLYVDVLGRTPSQAEMHPWVCRLQRCGCRKTLAIEFLQTASIELSNRLAPPPQPVREPAPVYVPATVRKVVPVAPRPYTPPQGPVASSRFQRVR